MGIFITGDTHGPIDTPHRFNVQYLMAQYDHYQFNKDNDYMIISGDFGHIFSTSTDNPGEKFWINNLNNKPWKTLFCDGNHENFERLLAMPEVEMFGGKVGQIAENIYHLKRGEWYDIDGSSFFVMGGGVSIDKENRTNRLSWWEEEMPNTREYTHAMETLEKHNYNVDYVITHTAPEFVKNALLEEAGMMVSEEDEEDEEGNIIRRPYKMRDQLSEFLEMIVKDNGLKFKKWYFGHYHVDATIDSPYGQFEALYNRVMRVV